MPPSQHSTHTHLYLQYDNNGCLERFGNGIPSGEMPEKEMAPCQTQPGRH